MYSRGPVIVMELPETLNHAEGEKFVSELQPLLEVHRPRIVLDCSQIRHMDSAGIETLLYCMQEAMKRDGDMKLASVSPESATIMELMRVDRLFEVFETADEAVRSFQAVASPDVPQSLPWYSPGLGLGDLKIAS
ncbi:MAG: anti-sigma-factor antagonist [Candidatus Sulfotelmatobacter sp.]|nr:anti-sigma-factor antagonist [Candidatus Sulfotelmatobacter sp.]